MVSAMKSAQPGWFFPRSPLETSWIRELRRWLPGVGDFQIHATDALNSIHIPTQGLPPRNRHPTLSANGESNAVRIFITANEPFDS
jgi:hypothetical protein